MSCIYIFYIHILKMHAMHFIYISLSLSLFLCFICLLNIVIVRFIYIISVLFDVSTDVPFYSYAFMYILCTVPGNILVWRFRNQ